MTAGRCNACHSVKGGVTFHKTQGIGFLSENGSSTVAILMHFEQQARNQKHYTPVGGSKSRHGTHWYSQEQEKEMQQHGSENRPE